MKLRKFALLSQCELYLGYSSADRLTCILLICIHNMSNNVIVSDKRNRDAFPSWSSTVCCHFAFPRENCSSVFGGNIVVDLSTNRKRAYTCYLSLCFDTLTKVNKIVSNNYHSFQLRSLKLFKESQRKDIYCFSCNSNYMNLIVMPWCH